MASKTRLLSLPNHILITLPNYLHDIEDYKNFAATCHTIRMAMNSATPNQILRLAIASSKIFFRPSPHFLVAATTRELGHWARQNAANERELATKLENGLEALLLLAEEHCGLTMDRIRQLYEMRFSLIKPVTDIMDKCVGDQWYGTANFWDGGVSDAYTIHSDPASSVFHLAIYGELFGPDFDAFFDPTNSTRRLSVETRLEFVKYCIPDYATFKCQDTARDVEMPYGHMDPRRVTKSTGPYAANEPIESDNNVALTWILKSSRWKPHWRAVREAAGPDFGELKDQWYVTSGKGRQRMWEACLLSQGLQGYEMMFENLRDEWVERAKDWRGKIARIQQEPGTVRVGSTHTYQYPWLAGDLRVLATGYVAGT